MPQLTKNQIIAMVGFFIMIIAIPISFYLVRQTQIFRSKASTTKTETGPVTKTPSATGSSADDLLKATQGQSGSTPSASSAENLAFGPTLNLAISIEGRPATKQADKVFVGLALGNSQINPSYILTFSIDVPDSGIFKGLSLAGLNPGSNYTAYIKGSSTIDSASTFTMTPTESNLNDNSPLILLSGDLNEDNTINAADYSICKGLYGTNPKSANWNVRADFNRDNIINNYDLSYITKNMGKVGASGPWVSTPKVSSGSATPSAGLINKPNVGGPPADFGSVLSASTNSASTPEEKPTRSSYWILVP
ncbi:MAG: dockerin type I repeat-containing protein [Microgenomates group bacterium]|jgi:hypothetical protein